MVLYTLGLFFGVLIGILSAYGWRSYQEWAHPAAPHVCPVPQTLSVDDELLCLLWAADEGQYLNPRPTGGQE